MLSPIELSRSGIEVWVRHPTYTAYEISNLGRVRSRRGIVNTDRGSGTSPYPRVFVYYQGKQTNIPVHQLVLETFVGRCPIGKVARHLNDNKRDNVLYNLCWGTRQENAEDAKRNGKARNVYGEDHGQTTLSNVQAEEIKLKLDIGWSRKVLANEYQTSITTIKRIAQGKWGLNCR